MQEKNKGFKGLNAKAFSLLVCCICAFALWVYVSYVENPDMSRWVRDIPVTVTGESKLNEKGLAITDFSIKDVNLKLRAKRNLFKYLTSDSIIATADVSEISRLGDNTVSVSIAFPSSASSVTVLERKNVSCSVNVEEYITKSFSVEPLISKDPAKDYFLESSTLSGSPIKVDISGGKSVVDSITTVSTTPVDLSKATESVVRSCSYIPLDKNGKKVEHISMSVTDADVTFTVYKKATVPVVIDYSYDNPHIITETTPNTVVILGPSASVDAVEAIHTLRIDESSYTSGMTVQLSVPSGLKLEGMDNPEVTITQSGREYKPSNQ